MIFAVGGPTTIASNGSGVVGIVCYEYHMFDGHLLDVMTTVPCGLVLHEYYGDMPNFPCRFESYGVAVAISGKVMRPTLSAPSPFHRTMLQQLNFHRPSHHLTRHPHSCVPPAHSRRPEVPPPDE